jgi:hypothetical protein
VTYLNYTSDQFTGLGGLVIPGTIRDSVYVLEALLEQESGLTPTEIIKPARKTPGFRHGDMSAVPFSGLGQRGHCSHLTLYRIYAIM